MVHCTAAASAQELVQAVRCWTKLPMGRCELYSIPRQPFLCVFRTTAPLHTSVCCLHADTGVDNPVSIPNLLAQTCDYQAAGRTGVSSHVGHNNRIGTEPP